MHPNTIYLASDHAGCVLRATIRAHLQATGHDVIDLGPADGDAVDYPDFGAKLAMALKDNADARGIAICGSG
ncbi:MAG TPA: ribose-5-phosphate isomerase, partial [Alphaproteobacteria bacterium]|nr:ribose-5-phosphate isomerase [Alphaproteobacteria bacterium]